MRKCILYYSQLRGGKELFLHLLALNSLWKWKFLVSDTLWPNGLYSPWSSPGQNTGVGSRSLLQGIFPTQGLNPCLLHCRWILYQLSHKGSPRILEWVAYPFFSGSFWPRNWTRVSCIVGGFFTNWALWEARIWRILQFMELYRPEYWSG